MTNENQTSSTSPRKSLPDKWVSRIFLELQGNYGTRFLNMWKVGQQASDGQDVGVMNAKRLWGEKLYTWADSPDRIKHVLDHLPPEPPTLPQFIAMLNCAPKAEPPPALPHKLTPEELEANRRRAADLIAKFAKSKRMPGSE